MQSPEDLGVVDQLVATDVGDVEDVMLPSPDASGESDVGTTPTFDMMIDPNRSCVDWTNCLSGEVCIDGACAPSTAELCASETALETTRRFDETAMCCLPEDEEVNGACGFPFRIDAILNGNQPVVTWTQQRQQFPDDTCTSMSNFDIQSDLVFEVPLAENVEGNRCVELSLEPSDTPLSLGGGDNEIPIEFEMFQLTSCCSQNLSTDDRQCAQITADNSKRWLNLDVTGLDKLQFGVRLRHAALTESQRMTLDAAEEAGVFWLNVRYSVGTTPCCNTDEDCNSFGDAGENPTCTSDNYCE